MTRQRLSAMFAGLCVIFAACAPGAGFGDHREPQFGRDYTTLPHYLVLRVDKRLAFGARPGANPLTTEGEFEATIAAGGMAAAVKETYFDRWRIFERVDVGSGVRDEVDLYFSFHVVFDRPGPQRIGSKATLVGVIETWDGQVLKTLAIDYRISKNPELTGPWPRVLSEFVALSPRIQEMTPRVLSGS